jgi:hypothetical protein
MRSKPIIFVKVNRTLWRRVLSFAGSGPDDPHYVLKTSGDKSTIHFGDGAHGATPRSGSTIEASYRTDYGASGNNVTVTVRTTLQRTRALCVAIHNRTKTISFKG